MIATASADEADRFAAYGAIQVIDPKAQKFEDEVHDVDLVLDLIGKETQDRSFQTLKRGGPLISTVRDPDPAKAEAAGVTAKRFMAKPDARQLAEFARLIDGTEVQVTVVKVFTLGQASEAHRMLEKGQHPIADGRWLQIRERRTADKGIVTVCVDVTELKRAEETLGLAISRRLIDLMGGRIGVSDRPGGGSIFWFELELAALAEPSQTHEFTDLRVRRP